MALFASKMEKSDLQKTNVFRQAIWTRNGLLPKLYAFWLPPLVQLSKGYWRFLAFEFGHAKKILVAEREASQSNKAQESTFSRSNLRVRQVYRFLIRPKLESYSSYDFSWTKIRFMRIKGWEAVFSNKETFNQWRHTPPTGVEIKLDSKMWGDRSSHYVG